MSFETKSSLDFFKNYYSTLADNLFIKVPTPPNKYTFNSIIQYYRHFIPSDAFHLTYTTEIYIIRSTKVRKVAGIAEFSGSFLKDGLRVLSKLISELCNLSIKLGIFPTPVRLQR